MIHLIYILALIKNHIDYLNNVILESFLRSIIDFFFFKNSENNGEESKVWRRKIIEDITNLFRLKKEQNDTAMKDIRNIFELKK